MTSINAATNQYSIDLQRDGKHRYSELDQDGDGVADGEALSGETGKMVNTGAGGLAIQVAVNKSNASSDSTTTTGTSSAVTSTLSQRGIEVTRTGINSSDGFTNDSTNAEAALDFSGAPTLPENTVRSAAGAATTTAALSSTSSSSSSSRIGSSGSTRAASSTEYEASLSDYQARTGGEDASLMWQALSTMAKTSMRDTHDAAELKNAMQLGKIEAKKNEITATEQQIEAEREAAAMNLMFAVLSSIVQIVLSGAAPGVGQALGTLIKSVGEYINKTSGPQAEADDKKVEVMRHQMMQEIFEQGVENAKTSYDEARELMKLAIKILTEHAERQTQITTTITRT